VDFGLRGKIALVAASSRGLGRAIAEELAAEGCDLLLCARGRDALEATRDAIAGTTSRHVVAVAADLSIADDVRRVVEAALDAFGHVDVLVTNAGGPPTGTFESLTIADWDAAVRLTLMSAIHLTHGVLGGMLERGWGRIINITSLTVKQPQDNLILSNSIRAAVTGFGRTLANEVAKRGVTVNNVIPGYIRTDRVTSLARMNAETRGTTPEQELASAERQIPMGRMGQPRELAALVAFLASERASYITGTSMTADGGFIRALY
jgi:3-oxoacyl-[acyl-carrier protein] reductase